MGGDTDTWHTNKVSLLTWTPIFMKLRGTPCLWGPDFSIQPGSNRPLGLEVTRDKERQDRMITFIPSQYKKNKTTTKQAHTHRVVITSVDYYWTAVQQHSNSQPHLSYSHEGVCTVSEQNITIPVEVISPQISMQYTIHNSSSQDKKQKNSFHDW